MRPMLFLLCITWCSLGIAQTSTSRLPSDLDYLKGREFLFFLEQDGREFAKVFSCRSAAIVETNAARLPCESGVGEPWSAIVMTDPTIPDLRVFMFYASDTAFIPANSYVYTFGLDQGVLTAPMYSQHVGSGVYSEARPGRVRFIEFSDTDPAWGNIFGGDKPLQISLKHRTTPSLNTSNGRLDLGVVEVGTTPDKYLVVMQRVPTDDGSFIFRVESAVKP